MNCKGSPGSYISTGVAPSPQNKLKFSRKFVIGLDETQENKETNEMEQRLLKYKKRYKLKKSKVSEEIKRNKEFKQELDFEQDQIRSLMKELEKEFNTHSKLSNEKAGIEKSTKQVNDILHSETFNAHIRGIEGSEVHSMNNTSQLEELQELLFMSNKKASDLERLLAREQKKNENLAKELKMLKIDLSSKLSTKIN